MAGLPLVGGRQAWKEQHRACRANAQETKQVSARPKGILQKY